MSLISVVIPVRNCERFIAETVESVLSQSHENFELIIIDDGSTDGTKETVSLFKDRRIQLYSYPPSGISISRNRGFEKSSGVYVSFLDADDLWTRNKLEAQLQALIDNKSASVAYSWVDEIAIDGMRVSPEWRPHFEGNVLNDMAVGYFPHCGSNILVERSAFLHTGGFDSAFEGVEDWELAIRLAERYKYALVCEPQIFYRIRKGSHSSSAIFSRENAGRRLVKEYSEAYRSNDERFSGLTNLYAQLTDRVMTADSPLLIRKLSILRLTLNWLKAVPPANWPKRLMAKRLKRALFSSD